MHHNLVILSSDAERYQEIINKAALPNLSVTTCTQVDPNNRQLRECDILFGSPDLISEALPYAEQLKWVQSMWAGVTPFMAPGLPQDYLLTGVKRIFGPIMAEYVFCHLLMHERQSLSRYQRQLQKQWDPTLPGTLFNKRIGIMGLGSIGTEVAKMAKMFAMQTYGFSRSQRHCQGVDRCFLPEQLIDFVKDLDYLFCVLPDTAATTGLIEQRVLAAMRPSAVIINAGRGNLIDHDALVNSLNKGEIAGAVLDVFPEEPLATDHPLWDAPNTIITSHTAAVSFPELVAPIFINNYQRFSQDKPLQYQIDFKRGY